MGMKARTEQEIHLVEERVGAEDLVALDGPRRGIDHTRILAEKFQDVAVDHMVVLVPFLPVGAKRDQVDVHVLQEDLEGRDQGEDEGDVFRLVPGSIEGARETDAQARAVRHPFVLELDAREREDPWHQEPQVGEVAQTIGILPLEEEPPIVGQTPEAEEPEMIQEVLIVDVGDADAHRILGETVGLEPFVKEIPVHDIPATKDQQVPIRPELGIVLVMVAEDREVRGIVLVPETLEDDAEHVVPAILFKEIADMKDHGTRIPFVNVQEMDLVPGVREHLRVQEEVVDVVAGHGQDLAPDIALPVRQPEIVPLGIGGEPAGESEQVGQMPLRLRGDETVGDPCDLVLGIELEKEHEIDVLAVRINVFPSDPLQEILKHIAEHGQSQAREAVAELNLDMTDGNMTIVPDPDRRRPERDDEPILVPINHLLQERHGVPVQRPIADHRKHSLVEPVIDGLAVHDAVLLDGPADGGRDDLLFLVQVHELSFEVQMDLPPEHAALVGEEIAVVQQPDVAVTVAEDATILVHVATKDVVHQMDDAERVGSGRIMVEDRHARAIKFVVIGE